MHFYGAPAAAEHASKPPLGGECPGRLGRGSGGRPGWPHNARWESGPTRAPAWQGTSLTGADFSAAVWADRLAALEAQLGFSPHPAVLWRRHRTPAAALAASAASTSV